MNVQGKTQSGSAQEHEIPAIIAIDGPAASGKSTLGRRLADSLGYLFLDTGVMYRAITWLVLQKGIPAGTSPGRHGAPRWMPTCQPYPPIAASAKP
jgi:hypothetical protein